MPLLTSKERSFLFKKSSSFLKDLSDTIISDLIAISNVSTYPKDNFIILHGDSNSNFFIVVSGLVRVSICSSTGKQITFLLVTPGEPFNMLSPYLKTPRFFEAEAMETTRCMWIKAKEYREFVEQNPSLATKMFEIIGMSLDNANSRILDIIEKKVELRIMRVLGTLHAKFGSPLHFTSREIAEIAGTTTESSLRTMAHLKKLKIIDSQRGKIWIEDPEALADTEFGNMYL